MEALIPAVLGDLASRAISFVFDKCREHRTMEEDLQRLHQLLQRISTVVEEAEGRHVENRAMLRQVGTMRDQISRGYYKNTDHEEYMFGRQMERERAISFLLQAEPLGHGILGVLPIVGPGLIGKSTPVEHVYDDERVRNAASLIQGISSSIEDACAELTDMLRRWQRYFEFAPQALLVLLLLDCAQDSNYSLSCQCDATFSDRQEGADTHASAKILATILQILKNIGTSEALGAPSPGEVVILDQIMEHLSLCVDGFLCAKAYQKERDLRRTPYGKIASELHRIGEKNGAIAFYRKYGYGVEGMFERL